MSTKFWLESLKGRGHSEDIGVGGRIILKWISGKWDWTVGTGFIWLRIGTSGGSCEHGNEHSSSIKGGEFLEQIISF
jgi:hypothetical protein